MAISPALPGSRDRPIKERACGEAQHVLCLGVLPFQAQNNGTSGTSSWKPVKDLIRTCMPKSAGDEPNVQIVDGYPDEFQPWAYVRLKKEENAKHVFDRIAGNTWYGAVLTVVWFFSPSLKILRLLRVGAELDQPEALETHSQIRDKRLLRRNPHKNHRQSTESLASNAMRIAMLAAANTTSPPTNPYSFPAEGQARKPNPTYHATTSQPWSYIDLNNQTHTWPNSLPVERPANQWIAPTTNNLLTSSPGLPMAGPNMTYPIPPIFMPLMPRLPQNIEDFDYPAMESSKDSNIMHNRKQHVKTIRSSGKTSERLAASKKPQDKTKLQDSSSSQAVVYSPPIIVDGSKSTSLK